jgi:hypothetical protein
VVASLVALSAACSGSSRGGSASSGTIAVHQLGNVRNAADLVRQLARRGVPCQQPVDKKPPAYSAQAFGYPHELWSCRLLGYQVALDVYTSDAGRESGLAALQQSACTQVGIQLGHGYSGPLNFRLFVYNANWNVSFANPSDIDAPSAAETEPVRQAAARLAAATAGRTYNGDCPDSTKMIRTLGPDSHSLCFTRVSPQAAWREAPCPTP